MTIRFLIFGLCCSIQFSGNAQTIIYSNNFTAGSDGFSLGQANNFDIWVVNSIYNCSSTTPNNGGGNYLHIADDLGGDYCAHAGFYGFGGSGSCLATMTSGVSTSGISQVNISFDWLCRGNAGFTPSYGTLEFSINGGSTWSAITNPINRFSGQNNWTTVNISSANYPALANQADLRLRFGWISSGVGQNPAFSIDNIVISGGQPIVCNNVAGVVSANSTNICAGSSVNLTVINAVGTLQWQSSADGINWQNINGANAANYTSNNLNSTTYYRALSQQTSCPDAISNNVMVEVTPLALTQVSINNVASTCLGTEINFTSNPSNAGDNPNYFWYVNGELVSNSSNFNSSLLNNGDQVNVAVVPNINCPAVDTAFSNLIIVAISPLPTVVFNLDDTLYLNQLPYSLNTGSPTGGTYTGIGVANNLFTTNNVGSYQISYSYTDVNGCTNAVNESVVVLEALSLENNLFNQRLYPVPNPASNSFMFLGLKNQSELLVYNAIGGIVLHKSIQPNEAIQCNNWSNGIYFYHLTANNRVSTGRWIKN